MEDDEEKFKLKDERYNPYFNFEFLFSVWYENEQISILSLPPDLQNYFKIINTTTNQTIPLNTAIKRKVSDIDIMILTESRLKKLKDFNVDGFSVDINYNGFVLDHQNKASSLYQENRYMLQNSFIFQYNNPVIALSRWRLVKYKADAGFLKLWNKLNNIDEESQKLIGLNFNSNDYYYYKPKDKNIEINGTEYYILGEIKYFIDYSRYDEYKRTKKSIWDTISIICSLSLTIFNALSVCLNFYSQNFDILIIL